MVGQDIIKSQELDVDGTRYLSTKYPARYASRLFAKLFKIVGKPLSMLAIGETKQSEGKDRMDLIGGAIDALMGEVDPSNFDRLLTEILEGTTIFDANGSNRKIVFDTDFQGRMFHLMKLAKEVLTFQYGDFLEGSVAGLPDLTTLRKQGVVKAL